MKKIYNYICKKRLIDATIGLLWVVLWVRVLALYGGITHIFYIAVNAFHKPIISIDISYGWGRSMDFPPVVFQFSVFGFSIINTGKRGFFELNKSAGEIMKRHTQEREEEKRLAKAARDAGL